GKLSDVENQVRDQGFLRIHKSYIVNPQYVDIYGKTTVTMTNGDVLSVSRERQKFVAEKMLSEILGD
ncbi:MAG: LytTR family transcriptional regulator DNA-binding domain-containing protein, partial [Clostridia bacterium]